MTASPSTAVSQPATAVKQHARSNRPWLLGAFLLAGAAQLITISALVSADPLAPYWWALLLGIAPVLLAAAAAFGPRVAVRPAVVAAVIAVIAGIVGSLASWQSSGTSHVGVLFFPALAVLLVGGVRLRRTDAP